MPSWVSDVAADAGYWLMIAGLIAAAAAAWAANFVTLPGNWLVVVIAVGAYFITTGDGPLMSLGAIGLLLGLAVVGEGVEFAASAAGAAKKGASRRGVTLSIVGAMGGSLAGAGAGVPIPVVGPLIGAVVGGALGAFAGAYLGEWWKRDRQHRDRVSIAAAALSGRLVGTVGKLLVGSVMLVVFAVALFL